MSRSAQLKVEERSNLARELALLVLTSFYFIHFRAHRLNLPPVNKGFGAEGQPNKWAGM
jgi:hypothetical protein